MVHFLSDTYASFSGEAEEMHKFIYQNLRWPKRAEGIGIQESILLRIVIKENGEITNVKVLRSLHESFDNEAIRIICLMPNFIPAKVGNKNVASYYNANSF